MAASPQRILLTLGFCSYIILFTIVSTTGTYYETSLIEHNQRNTKTIYQFVPLEDGSVRSRRQAPNSSNTLNVGKSRSGATVKGTSGKVDKNSASVLPDGSTKNLSSAPDDDSEEKDEYDEQVIQDLVNPYGNLTKVDRPTIHHDHHLYYNSTVVMEPQRINEYWVDLNTFGKDKVITQSMLSKSYRRAVTVTLSFEFPFYGHVLKSATIATGGFLYLGDHMHSWLASTQYIAPLMANFDTRLHESSAIKYADNGTDFIVQWEETSLQDFASAGTFTFQVRLKRNGDIVFAYSKIPIGISAIPDSEHPVRIGVSDAYILDRAMLFHTRKIIYEYHRVEIKKENITNLTAVYLTALPSCITLKDCESCITSDIQFDCTWCAQAQRCSDGMDRFRHEWLYKGCDAASQQLHEPFCPPAVTDAPVILANESVSGAWFTTFHPSEFTSDLSRHSNSPSPTNNNNITASATETYSKASLSTITDTSPSHTNLLDATQLLSQNQTDMKMGYNSLTQRRTTTEKSSLGAEGIIGIIFVITLIGGLVLWLLYAYRNPHSPSGQIVIRYRPSQWHWLRGEADYTPASVHI